MRARTPQLAVAPIDAACGLLRRRAYALGGLRVGLALAAPFAPQAASEMEDRP